MQLSRAASTSREVTTGTHTEKTRLSRFSAILPWLLLVWLLQKVLY